MRNKRFEETLKTMGMEELKELQEKLFNLFEVDGLPILNIYVTVKQEVLKREKEEREREERIALYPDRLRHKD